MPSYIQEEGDLIFPLRRHGICGRISHGRKNPFQEVYMPNFGELLRRLRGSRSQREVATDLQMPVTTLSTLENQETVPRGPVLKKLAVYFGVSVTYFYSSSASEMKSTCAASAWLQRVRHNSNIKETIATYAPPDYPEEIKNKIAEKIAERISKNKRGNKTSNRSET
jgi:transcriptional regulator with XRE-family HTH domain